MGYDGDANCAVLSFVGYALLIAVAISLIFIFFFVEDENNPKIELQNGCYTNETINKMIKNNGNQAQAMITYNKINCKETKEAIS